MWLQIGSLGSGIVDNPVLSLIMFYGPFILFLLYGQKLQARLIMNDVLRSLRRLEVMKDKARKDSIDYLTTTCKLPQNRIERVDQFLEYFTILPVDIDPNGIVRKIEHVMLTRDESIRSEIQRITPTSDSMQRSAVENILEVASALNLIHKIVRHFYLLGKKSGSIYVLVSLQMIMPIILKEAQALEKAIDAFKQFQPIGDGIGPMVAGRMMLKKEKRLISKDTVYCEADYKGRLLYLIKAEGPHGNVGQPGRALEKLVSEMGAKPNAIIMIDGALKLEGDKTGDISEGIGAAIGGIGVDRFQIEEVATKNGIPLYAIVIKQSIIEAISVMKKEIAEAAEKVFTTVQTMIEDKTSIGDKIVVIGVGNTLGVAQ